MKNNPVAWFEIYVDDMQRAKKFYEQVFDVQLTKLFSEELEMWAFPMKENEWGAAGTLAKMEGIRPGHNSVLVYFTSEDCSIEEKRVTNAGGKVFKNKTSIGEYGFITLAQDTEGNMFGIHSKI